MLEQKREVSYQRKLNKSYTLSLVTSHCQLSQNFFLPTYIISQWFLPLALRWEIGKRKGRRIEKKRERGRERE